MERRPSADRVPPGADLLARAFHENPTALALVDDCGAWLDVNDAFCRLTGMDRAGLLATPLAGLLHPHDAAADREDERRLRAGEVPAYEATTRWLRPDGGIVTARATVSLLHGDRATSPRLLRARPEEAARAADRAGRKATDQLAAVVTTQQELALADGDLDAVLDLVTARTRWITGADGARIELLEHDEIVCAAASGLGAGAAPRRRRTESLAARAALAGRVVRCDDATACRSPQRDACAELGAGSLVSVPLQHERGVVGALAVLAAEPGAFDDRDVQVLQLLAELIATAIVRSTEDEARRELLDELTAAHAALRQSEARTRSILDSAHDAFISLDADGIVTDWNAAAEALFGWSHAEAVGRPTEMLALPRHREANRRIRHELLADAAAAGRTTGRRLELIGVDRRGREFPLEATLTATPGPDGAWQVHAFVHDISERRRAGEELRRSQDTLQDLFENATDLIQVADVDGFVLYANRAWCEALGYAQDELEELDTLELVRPDRREDFDLLRRSVLADGQRRTVETVLVGRDGREVVVEGNLNVRFENGVAVATRAIFHDIGERKVAELEREVLYRREREQVERLRELDRLKDEFVSVVSHELRTPLTSISGYLDIVREGDAGPLTDEQERFLGIVDRNARRLVELVGDLLFVSRLDSGTLTFEREDVDAAALVADAVEGVRPLAESRGVQVATVVGTVPTFAGDAARLAQMLDNLVSNAVKFTPAGGRVSVRLERRGDQVSLEVEDTGIGIPEADHDRIFQRFFRASSATEAAIQGTGLGLAISRAIVEGHGGAIAFRSEAGVGTTFSVLLPAAAAADLAA